METRRYLISRVIRAGHTALLRRHSTSRYVGKYALRMYVQDIARRGRSQTVNALRLDDPTTCLSAFLMKNDAATSETTCGLFGWRECLKEGGSAKSAAASCTRNAERQSWSHLEGNFITPSGLHPQSQHTPSS